MITPSSRLVRHPASILALLPPLDALRTPRPQIFSLAHHPLLGSVESLGLLALGLSAFVALLMIVRARRLRAERELIAQKERYELAMRASTEGVWDWDILANTTYWSRRLAQTLGIHTEDSTRLGTTDLWRTRLHPDDQSRVIAALNRHVEHDEPYDSEYRLRVADGSYRWFRSRGKAIRDERGRAIRMNGSLVDVTEQVVTREALKEREERYRLAVQSGRVAVWSVDIASGMLDADPLLHELHHGVTGAADRTPAADWGRSVHPEDLARVKPLWDACVSGSTDRYDVEIRVIHRDSSVHWIQVRARSQRDQSGRVFAVRGTTQDVTDLKDALERLRDAQARLEAVTDNIPGMVYSSIQTGPTRHRVQYVSRGCLELIGTPASRLIGMEIDLAETVLPEDADRLQSSPVSPQSAGGQRQVEYRIRHPDGHIKWIRDVARFRPQPDGTTLWDGMLIDQTALRAAEEARALTEQRYRIVIEASRAGVWDWDLITNNCFVSDELARAFGLGAVGPESLIERWRALIHPDDAPSGLAALDRHWQDGVPYDFEYRVRRPSGDYRWVRSRGQAQRDHEGRAVRMIGSLVDVHERKCAELALKESEFKYRTIVETADEGIWLVDADWRTTFANARIAEMLGRTVPEMLGMHITEFMDDEGRAIVAAYMDRRQRGERERHEFKFVRPDATPVWTFISTNPVFAPDGSFAGALAMVTDISARRESDLAVQRLRRLFLNGPVVAWHWRNTPGWPVEYVSENITTFGYQADEFTSGRRSFASILLPADLQRVAAEVQEHVQNHAQTFRQEYRIITADGRTRWLADYSVVERDSAGVVTYFAGYTFDDTERKAQDQLRAAERRVLELIARGARIDESLLAVVQLVDEADPDVMSSVLLLQPDGTARSGPAPRLPPDYVRAIDGFKVGPNVGSCGTAMHSASRVITTDIESDPRWDQPRQIALAHGLRACWSEPILSSSGEVLGSLAMYAPVPRTPSPREIDIIVSAAHLAGIAIERSRAEQALRDREQRLRLLVDSTPLGVISFDTSFRILEWNHGAERIFGYTASEAIGQSAAMIVPDESRAYVDKICRDLLANRGGYRGTNSNICKDGRTISCEWYNSPLIGPDGAVIAVACVVDDVTEAREARRRQDLMMVELDHRVKNNLATIMSLADQTGDSAADYADFRVAFFARLRALARMHAALAKANWRGVDLELLVRQTLDTYAPEPSGRSSMSGPPVVLTPRATQALALTLNELGTNAAKHGALSAPAGSVNVQWRLEESENLHPKLTLTWRESGGPPTAEPVHRGLGRSLIEGIIRHELRGSATLDFAPTGLICTLSFVLEPESENPEVTLISPDSNAGLSP